MSSQKAIHKLPAALFLALSAVGAPAAAWDYRTCVGDRIDWGQTTVNYYPHNAAFPPGSAKRAALEAAFAAWHAAPGTRFHFNTIWDSSPTITLGDGKNSVFTTRDYNFDGAIGVTVIRYSCSWWGWGDLQEADVIFNDNESWTFSANPASPPDPFSPFNLPIVAIHELGHSFGLNHQTHAVASLNHRYPDGGTIGNANAVQPHADDVLGNRVGYGTCCTARDVYASAYRSTSAIDTDHIVPPSQAIRGQPVGFQFTIGNRGTSNESVRVQFHLSTDRFISTADTFLGAANFSLSSGGTPTFNASVTIPGSQPSGHYYLGWIVDPLGSITEVHEGNNAVAMATSTFVPSFAPPIACGGLSPSSGNAPLDVSFDGSCSYDPDGWITSYYWDFGDGTTSSSPSGQHTYWSPGFYSASLTVVDNEGYSATSWHNVSVFSDCGGEFCV